MSRKKPRSVYRVITGEGLDIYVLARHAKGARSVAEAHGHQVETGHGNIMCVGPEYADQAINREQST